MERLLHYSQSLQPDWLDAYGHLNEAYYFVAFTNAGWHMGEALGMGAEYLQRSGCALYTVETHIRFLKEVRAPAELHIEAFFLEYDAKRLRYIMILKVDGIDRATLESVAVHIDTTLGRSAPIPDEILKRLEEHKFGQMPEWAGHGISLLRR